jgi:hypothetical protein
MVNGFFHGEVGGKDSGFRVVSIGFHADQSTDAIRRRTAGPRSLGRHVSPPLSAWWLTVGTCPWIDFRTREEAPGGRGLGAWAGGGVDASKAPGVEASLYVSGPFVDRVSRVPI